MQNTPAYSGKLSLHVTNDEHLLDLCVRHIPGYDTRRLKIVAFRVFAEKEFVLTVYAQDRDYNSSIHPGKVMVRKFKLSKVPPAEVLACIAGFNATVFLDSYGDFDMEVINK